MQAFEDFLDKSQASLELSRLDLHFELDKSSSRFANINAKQARKTYFYYKLTRRRIYNKQDNVKLK